MSPGQFLGKARRVVFGSWIGTGAVVYLAAIVAASNITVNGVPVIRHVLPTSHNTLPAREMGASQGIDLSAALAAGQPKLVYAGKEIVASNNGNSYTYAHFVLVNPLDVPIAYHGYLMSSWSSRPPLGLIHPFCAQQQTDAANPQWHDKPRGYCGTGAGEMIVPPHHAGLFIDSLDAAALSAKIGVSCTWQGPNGQPVEAMIWSDEINPAGG